MEERDRNGFILFPHFPILISRGVMEPRDRDTEGDKGEPEGAEDGGVGGCVDRGPLGLPRPGGGALLSSFLQPARWASGGTWRGGAGQLLLLCPAPGPRGEGEKGGQKGQEEMEEKRHRERRIRVSVRVWSAGRRGQRRTRFGTRSGVLRGEQRESDNPTLASCRRSSRFLDEALGTSGSP